MKNLEIDIKELISTFLKNDATVYSVDGIEINIEEDSLACDGDELNIYFDRQKCTIGIGTFALYRALYDQKTLERLLQEKKYNIMSKEINITAKETEMKNIRFINLTPESHDYKDILVLGDPIRDNEGKIIGYNGLCKL